MKKYQATQSIDSMDGAPFQAAVDVWTIHGDDPHACDNVRQLKEIIL